MNFKINFKRKFTAKEESDILKKLSLYISAHIPLVEALGMLSEQTPNEIKRKTFVRWQFLVSEGRPLATACIVKKGKKLEKEDESLSVSRVFLYACELGERSGSLATALKNTYEQIEKSIAIKKKITGAVAYPTAILCGTVLLVTGLMMFVFPKIIPLFETLKVSLPWSTKLLISMSRFLTEYWWLILSFVVFAPVTVAVSIKSSLLVRNLFQKILLRIPIVGQVVKTKIIVTIFDSLFALTRGGEQLSEALSVVVATTSYIQYKFVLTEAAEIVVQGKSLAEFFKQKQFLFPSYIFGIIAVGERTGNLENSLQSISEIAKEDLEDRLRILTAALEPILMVAMSLVIGFIAISIILPIYGITNHFQSV